MNVYLQAAEAIFKGQEEHSCCAISAIECGNDWAKYSAKSKFRRAYERRFSANKILAQKYLREERKEWRLTALCLAAAMHDEGDL